MEDINDEIRNYLRSNDKLVKHFDKLMELTDFLMCLETHGVSDWEGYEAAQEMFNEM